MKNLTILLSSLLFINLYAQEETSSIENAVDNTEQVADEKSAPIEAKSQEVEEFTYLDVVKIYFKNNKHKDAEEILWQLSDSNYSAIKNNDFEYQKVKEPKYKEMRELIANAENNKLYLNTEIVLGSYDFKKEEFPVKDILNIATIMSLEISIMKYDFSVTSAAYNLDKYELGNSARLKILNLDKLKNIKVKKDIAEKITAGFDTRRRVKCIMSFDKPKVKNEKSKFGKMYYYNIKGTISFSEGKCFFDGRRTQEAFSH